MKRILNFIALSFINISGFCQTWIPQNSNDLTLINHLISDFKQSNNLNQIDQIRFITVKYLTCEWCKKEVSKNDNLNLKTIPIVFPLEDSSVAPLIVEQFKNKQIIFNDRIFELLDKMNVDPLKTYLVTLNLEPRYIQISALNANNLIDLTSGQSERTIHYEKICKVPVGSFLLKFTAVTSLGTYFTDVRNRLFWLNQDDTIAKEFNLLNQLNYDSILKRIPNPKGELVYEKDLNGKIRDKYTVMGIFPSGNNTVFHIGLNYLFKKGKDTMVLWMSTLFVTQKPNREIIVEIMSASEIDATMKSGRTNAFRFLHPFPNGRKIVGRIFQENELNEMLNHKKDKSTLAVEIDALKIGEIDSSGHSNWINNQLEKYPSFKKHKEFNIPNTVLTSLNKESNDFGLIMNSFVNNHFFFNKMPYSFSLSKDKLIELTWWKDLNFSYESNLFLQSASFNEKQKVYLFAFSIKSGMLFVTTDVNFKLMKLDKVTNPLFSNAKIILEKRSCFQSGDQVYKMNFE